MKTFLLFVLSSLLITSCNDSQEEIEYYSNGNIKYQVGIDKEGHRNGVYKEFYESGALKTLWEYDHGIEHGDYKEFSESGDLKVYGKMDQGDFVVSEGYDSLGNVFERRFYLKGQIYYVEKFNRNGEKKEQTAWPILFSTKDTVSVDEEYCLTIETGIQFKGEVILTVGHMVGEERQHLDTIAFEGQSYNYCVRSKSIGQNQIRGFFDHQLSDGDTAIIDHVSFKHTFYVKEDPNHRSI